MISAWIALYFMIYWCKEDVLLVNVHFYTIMRYELMKWKILRIRGCDYRSLDPIWHQIRSFVSVPLTIQVGGLSTQIDAHLNIDPR